MVNKPKEGAARVYMDASGAMADQARAAGTESFNEAAGQILEQRPMMTDPESAMQFEDILINQFLEKETSIFPTPGVTGEAKYNGLSFDDQQKFDLHAFEYFRQAHELKAQENPKYQGVKFVNFVNMFHPDEGFEKVLREPNWEGTTAEVWSKMYDQNTNLMKESALKGLKRAIASSL
jgi:hypothetical protein